MVIRKDWGLFSDLLKENGYSNVTPLIDCWQDGGWDMVELETIRDGVKDLAQAMGGSERFKKFIGQVTITKMKRNIFGYPNGRAVTPYWNRNIDILDSGNPPTIVELRNPYTNIDKWTVVHELGHAWDRNNSWKLSKLLMAKMGGSLGNKPSNCVSNRLPGCNSAGYDWGSNPPPGGSDNSFNEKEDFAESVTAYVYPNQAKKNADDIIAKDPQLFTQYFYYSDYTTTDRWKFVDGLIAGTLP